MRTGIAASRETRRRRGQERARVTRGRIAEGAIAVLAQDGVPGLTHRAVARAAGVPLAATTYHFTTKSDIIDEASRSLLDGYVAAFRRMAARIAAGEERRVERLADLVDRVVLNALGRERTRSLAWSELILHGGRSDEGRAIARCWYDELDAIWSGIASLVEPGAAVQRASAAIDLTVGLTFVLHPLTLDGPTVASILAGKRDIGPLLEKMADRPTRSNGPAGGETGTRNLATRQRIVDAAIAVLVSEGAGAISHRRVAELAGMVRSGPGYYFATIGELLTTAQVALFERAKLRYRAGAASLQAPDLGADRLLDLTTAILFREALEFGRESIGHYSVWTRAAGNPSLAPAVAASLLDQHRAWSRRIAALPGAADAAPVALRMQALFIGKLIRAIAAAIPVTELSRARADFAAALRGGARVAAINGTYV